MTFTEETKQEFAHTKAPLLYEGKDLESMLFQFAADANGSSHPLRWGENDFVFPTKSFGTAHHVLMTDRYMKQYRKKGIIEFVAKEEEVDSITLSAPLFGYQQTIYFYES